MTKKCLLISVFSFAVFFTFATAPLGYYNDTEGKKNSILKTALHNLICQDTTHYLDYGSGAGKTWEGFYSTDRDMTTNAVIDMYSPNVLYFPNPNPTFVSFGQDIHIEHSVPKSWWGCDISHPDCPAKDLHHLFPADGTTNISKNDNPLGVVSGTPTLSNGVSKVGPGAYNGYVGNVFEPADQYKGDFARAYFYMATAYEHYVTKWDTNKPENMMQNNQYPVLKPWALALLLQWHRQDPVSSKEVTRNNVVFGIQKNRNPYIDYPKLVEYVWGDRTTIPFRLDGNTNFPYLNWPSTNDTIKLGKTYRFEVKDSAINLQAMNLTGDLSLTLSGANANYFNIDKTTITKTEAETGLIIPIHFNAQVAGYQSTNLTISGGGISSVTIIITANSSDDFAALPPKATNNSGFVASWTASVGATDYLLNLYTIDNTGTTTTKTLVEEDFLLTMPNTWSKEGTTDYSVYSNIKLGTGTNYGKITTPVLDLSTGTSILTVRARQFSNDAGAKLTATLNGQALASWATAVANQDFSIDIPIGTATSSIALSAAAGKRVYVDYVKVQTQVPVFGPVTISNYPKFVGNVLSHTVTGLLSGKTYYYTVTPVGNGSIASNQIAVQTSASTALVNSKLSEIKWTTTPTGINVKNLTSGAIISIFDSAGIKIKKVSANSSEVWVKLPQHGLYVLQIEQNKVYSNKIKVIF